MAEAMDTRAKTDPEQIKVFNILTANYADGRQARRSEWVEGNKTADAAVRASAEWVEKNLKALVEIGGDDV